MPSDESLVLDILLRGRDLISPEVERARASLRRLQADLAATAQNAGIGGGAIRTRRVPAAPRTPAVPVAPTTGGAAADPVTATLERARRAAQQLQRDTTPAAAALAALAPAVAGPARALQELERASGALKTLQTAAVQGTGAPKQAVADLQEATKALGNLQRAERGLQQAAQAATAPRRGESDLAATTRALAGVQQATRAWQQLQREQEKAEASLKRQSGGGISAVGLVTGLAAAQGVIGLVERAFGGLGDAIFGANARLEQAQLTFEQFTKSASAAQAIVEALRHEADISPFDTGEVVDAGKALIGAARGSQDALLGLVKTAEVLAALQPEQGLRGAAFALREASAGQFESVIQRFNLSREAINRFAAEGKSGIDAVRAALAEMGADSRLVERLGQSFEGRKSTIAAFFTELQRRAGEGIFQRISDDFGRMTAFIARDGDRLNAEASRIGAVLGALFGRVEAAAGTLATAVLNRLSPGLGDAIAADFAAIPAAAREAEGAVADTQAAAQQLARSLSLPEAQQGLAAAGTSLDRLRGLASQVERPVKELDRAFAALGRQVAGIQLDADRVRRGYEAQITPLEAQLRRLQDARDYDQERARLGLELEATAARQAALAADTHRAERDALTAEQEDLRTQQRRMELDRTLPRLEQRRAQIEQTPEEQRTDRQKAQLNAIKQIELERRQLDLQPGPEVRRAEQAAAEAEAAGALLDIDKQRAQVTRDLAALPLEQRLQALKAAEDAALAPLQAQLDRLRDQQGALDLQRQSWGLLKADIDLAADAAERLPKTLPVPEMDDAAARQRQDEFRAQGEKVAADFAKGYQDWLDKNGGSVWGAVTKSLNAYIAGPGKTPLEETGEVLGEAVMRGVARAVGLGPLVGDTPRGGSGPGAPPPPAPPPNPLAPKLDISIPKDQPNPEAVTPASMAAAEQKYRDLQARTEPAAQEVTPVPQAPVPTSVPPRAAQPAAPVQTQAMAAAEQRYRDLQAQQTQALPPIPEAVQRRFDALDMRDRGGPAPDAAGQIRDALARAGDAVDDATSQRLRDLGGDAAQGFIDALRSGDRDAAAAATDLSRAAVDAVADALEIRSPSRVLYRLGEETVAGFTAALAAGRGDVLAQVRALLALPDDLPPLPEIPAPRVGQPVVPDPLLPEVPVLPAPLINQPAIPLPDLPDLPMLAAPAIGQPVIPDPVLPDFAAVGQQALDAFLAPFRAADDQVRAAIGGAFGRLRSGEAAPTGADETTPRIGNDRQRALPDLAAPPALIGAAGAGGGPPPVAITFAAGAIIVEGSGTDGAVTMADVQRAVEDGVHQALREYNAVRQRTLPGAPGVLAGVRR